jgi:hypothetical protein
VVSGRKWGQRETGPTRNRQHSQGPQRWHCGPPSNHHPDFVVDLKAIPLGAKIGTTAVLELLAKNTGP